MRSTLQLKFGQQLTLTPQLQQAIRLLQLSSQELEMEIRQALESNLLLEQIEPEEENLTLEMALPNSELSHQPIYSIDSTYLPNDAQKQNTQKHDLLLQKSPDLTLKQHLFWQMEISRFTAQDHAIATTIIDSISEDGYLTSSLVDIQEAFEEKPDISEIERVLFKIQQFDPIGVGARDLSECLKIQLEAFPISNPWIKEAKLLVSSYLVALGEKKFQYIKSQLSLSDEALKETIKILKSLNPRPGTQVLSKKSEVAIPDIIVSKKGNQYLVSLNNQAMPNIRLNNNYLSFIETGNPNEEFHPFKVHLKEARFFLKGLRIRNETLLKVATCIMEQQKEFLEFGACAMKPFNLQDIANLVELHESTISRITSHKLILTPRGLFELKYFFSNAISSSCGLEASSTAIRAYIQKIITEESSQTPLSDHKITKILLEQGISIARRTVTKYREALNIPTSTERKNLNINL